MCINTAWKTFATHQKQALHAHTSPHSGSHIHIKSRLWLQIKDDFDCRSFRQIKILPIIHLLSFSLFHLHMLSRSLALSLSLSLSRSCTRRWRKHIVSRNDEEEAGSSGKDLEKIALNLKRSSGSRWDGVEMRVTIKWAYWWGKWHLAAGMHKESCVMRISRLLSTHVAFSNGHKDCNHFLKNSPPRYWFWPATRRGAIMMLKGRSTTWID